MLVTFELFRFSFASQVTNVPSPLCPVTIRIIFYPSYVSIAYTHHKSLRISISREKGSPDSFQVSSSRRSPTRLASYLIAIRATRRQVDADRCCQTRSADNEIRRRIVP